MACKIDTNLSGNDGKAMRIVKFFVEKGLTPTQACAICGNVYKESGYNETSVNKLSGAFGLFQYLPKYSKDLQSSPKKNDFDYQLDYTWGRYNAHKHYGDSNKGSAMYKKWHTTELGEYFKQNKGTLNDYVELWMCAFERCGVSEAGLEKRKREAKRVAELFNKHSSGDCAENKVIVPDNESANTDNTETTNNNGAVTDASVSQVDCTNVTVNGIAVGGSGGSTPTGGEGGDGGGAAGEGFSGEVTNPKMKKVLSQIEYFKNRGKSIPGCPSGAMCPLRGHKYWGKCTYGPTTFYSNAGISLYFWCNVYGACRKQSKGYPLFPTFNCIKKTMDRYGFYLAGHWDFDVARNLEPSKYFRPGDVATLAASPCGAHGLMYTGHDWRSDVIEKNICSAYPRTNKGKFGDYSVCIWRRLDCQEPQYQNEKPLPCTIC